MLFVYIFFHGNEYSSRNLNFFDFIELIFFQIYEH